MKENRIFPFLHLSIRKKFLLINLVSLLLVILMGILMTVMVSHSEADRRKKLENMAVTAAEQHVRLSVENAVSIAKSIYTNAALNDLLSRDYSSSSEYFDAYYRLQQSSPLMPAEFGFVNGFKIYSDNPDIMNGGDIQSLTSVEDQGWYQDVLRKKKDVLLYCDSKRNGISLIRRLDYYAQDMGECYLRLDLNSSVLKKDCDELNFDGELYVVGEGVLIYSNQSDSTMDSVQISQEFTRYTKNYYSVELEYYAKARVASPMEYIRKHLFPVTLIAVVTAAMEVLTFLLSASVLKRSKKAEKLYQEEGTLIGIRDENSGSDEIGSLLRIGASLSEKLAIKNFQYKHSLEQLAHRQTDIRELYNTAMEQDADITMHKLYPDLCVEHTRHSLAEEIALIGKIAKRFDNCTAALPENIPGDKNFPTYALALVADGLFRLGGDMTITCSSGLTNIHFESNTLPDKHMLLKLGAVFEDGDVMTAYPFRRQYVYNPYIRLKHIMGNQIQAEITLSEKFTIDLALKRTDSIS